MKDNEMTREQKFERENEILRLEIEYLKSSSLSGGSERLSQKSTSISIITTQRRIPDRRVYNV